MGRGELKGRIMWEKLANGGMVCTSTGGITAYCGKCDLSMLEAQRKMGGKVGW